jgi:hypothetical protein
MVDLTTSCPPRFVLWRLCLVFILFFTSSSLPLFFGGLILRFETDSIHFFCVGLIYDVSWVFSLKEFNQFLTRSQIVSNHGLGFENRCFSFPFDFLVICLILGDDLLGVAYQLGIDPLYKVSSHFEVFWSSFGLEIDFFWEQLVNTRRVRYWYRTCLAFPTFEFRAEIWWRPSLWCLEAMVEISWFLDTIC